MSARWALFLAVTMILDATALGSGLRHADAAAAGPETRPGPSARILSPADGASYASGELIPLVAETAQGDLPQPPTFQWEVSLIRNGRDEVAHLTAAGARTSFVAQEESDDASLSYRVRLIALNPQGQNDTIDVSLFPKSSFDKSRAINPGDVLQVTVYAGGEKQEDFEAQVSAAGYMTSPLIGELHVSGLTPFKVADTMRALLGERFYVNPQVLVALKESGGKVFVSGEVNRPGAYGLQEGLTVLKLCAIAGGFTNYAALNAVKVTRYDRSGPRTYKLDLGKVRDGKQQDMTLQNGDQVDVPHRRF